MNLPVETHLSCHAIPRLFLPSQLRRICPALRPTFSPCPAPERPPPRISSLPRCRKLYERYLEWNAANCQAWTKFADLEILLGEVGRTRGIYELAISQPMLDMPEALWKVRGSWEGRCRQAPGLGLIESLRPRWCRGQGYDWADEG